MSRVRPAGFIVTALVLGCAASAQAADVQVKAGQDTVIDASAPNRTLGAAKALRLSAKPLRRAFLRFDLRGLSGTPSKVVLRVYLSGKSGGRINVNALAAGQSWSEARTTFKKAPTIAAAVTRSGRAKRAGWLNVDVTGLVALGRVSDLAVSGAPRAVVASRESKRGPRLIVTPGGSGSTPGPPFPPPGPPFPPPGLPPGVPPPFGGIAPVVTLDPANPANSSEGQTHTFKYTVTDPDSTPTVTESCGTAGQDAGQDTTGSFNCTFPDGPATATVAVTADDGSHVGSAQMDVSIANVGPSLTAPATQTTAEGTSKSFALGSFADPGSDTWTADVDWGDAGTSSFGATPGTLPDKPHTYDDNGPYPVTVKVTDKDKASDFKTFTVDVANVPPSATFNAPASITAGSPIDLALTGATDPSHADAEKGFTYAFDCGTGSGYGPFEADNHASCPTTDKGTRTVKGKVRDKDGGEREYTADVTIANAAPVVTPPADQSSDEGSAKAFDLGAFTDAGITEGPWSVDVDWGDTSAPEHFDVTSRGSLGNKRHTYEDGPATYTVAVKVSDEDGGSDTKTFRVTVSNAAPQLTFDDNTPTSAGEGETKTFAYSISDPGDDTVKSVTASCGDGTMVAGSDTHTDAGGSFKCTFPDGPNTTLVFAYATDSDGDPPGGIDSKTVSVADVAPSVTLNGPASSDEGQTQTYTFTVSDPGRDTFDKADGFPDCDTTGAKGELVAGSYTVDPSGGSFKCLFPDGPARANVKMKVVDSDGASDADSERVAITSVDNVAPAATAPGDQTADEGTPAWLNLGSFGDPGSDTWTVDVDWGDKSSEPSFPVASTGTLPAKLHSYADNGTYTVTVTVTDEDGGTDFKTFQVKVANVAPTVKLDQNNATSANEGDTKAFTYSITDPGKDTVSGVDLKCGDGQLIGETHTDTGGTFQCRFPDGPAKYTVSAAATDSDGATGAADTMPVQVANVAPTVHLEGTQTADEGGTYTYTYSITDPGDDPNPKVTESCGANGRRIDTPAPDSFDCFFPDGPASSTVSVTADDSDPADNSGAQQLASTVRNVAPAVTAPADQSATTGTASSIDLGSFTDPSPGDTPYTVDVDWGDDSSDSFTTTSTGGLGTHDHSYAADGDHPVSVTVTDRDGGKSAPATFTVTSSSPTQVTVELDAAPNSPQPFDFTMARSGQAPENFTLVDDTDPDKAAKTFTLGAGDLGARTLTGPDVTGWTLSGPDSHCDGDADAAFEAGTRTAQLDVDRGEQVVCHFRYVKDATVTVVHDAHPDSGEDFTYNVMGRHDESFQLDDDADPTLESSKTFAVRGGELGAWVVSAADHPGWAVGQLKCTGDSEADQLDSRTYELNVDAGENIVCRFDQDKDATVTVTEDASPDSSQAFGFTATGRPNFSLTDDGTPTSAKTESFRVSADGFGRRSITQAASAFWALDGIDCTGDPDAKAAVDSRQVDLVVDPGETIACTFRNHRVATTIGGVFPESSSVSGPIEDGNGNLYTVNELGSGENGNTNHPYPTIKKSVDGGQTWSEVDGANRPTQEDLESVALVYEGQSRDPQSGLVHMLQQQSSMNDGSGTRYQKVYYHSFWTENGPGGSDEWATKGELVAAPYGNAQSCASSTNLSCGPSDQAVSLLERRQTGDLIAIYNTNRSACTPVSPATTCTGFQRIGYRIKPFGGSWGSENVLDNASGVNFTQAVAVMGDNDVAHIFYKDDTNNRIYYKTLDASGTLSGHLDQTGDGATNDWLNSNGTDGNDHALVSPPVRLHVGSTERIVVGWKRATGEVLNSVTIDGGVVGNQTQVSPRPAMSNPDSTQSVQPVASLAADDSADKVDIVFAACGYGTLTAALPAGTNTLTMDSTEALVAGQSITVDSESKVIRTVNSSTSLTLTTSLAGAHSAGGVVKAAGCKGVSSGSPDTVADPERIMLGNTLSPDGSWGSDVKWLDVSYKVASVQASVFSNSNDLVPSGNQLGVVFDQETCWNPCTPQVDNTVKYTQTSAP